MKENFDKSLQYVFKWEGGFSNHPHDNGGATNKGVTLRNFRRWVKPDGTITDLKKLTDAQAGVVYRRRYWDVVDGSDLPSGVDYAVFDFAVNSGPSRAVKFVQRIVDVPVDGRMGPVTMEAIWKEDPEQLVIALCNNRLDWLKGLSDWEHFGRGWERRVLFVRKKAKAMADKLPVPEEKTESNVGELIVSILKKVFS